jgi:hypothetical protein
MPKKEEKTPRPVIIVYEDDTSSKQRSRLLANSLSEQSDEDPIYPANIMQFPYEEKYVDNNKLFFEELMKHNPYTVIFFNEDWNIDIKHICENFSSQYKDVICIHIQHSSEPWATLKIGDIHIINNYIELSEVAKQIREIILLDTMILNFNFKCQHGKITTDQLANTPRN